MGMATDLGPIRLFHARLLESGAGFPYFYFGDKAGRGSPSPSGCGKRPGLGGGVGRRKPAL